MHSEPRAITVAFVRRIVAAALLGLMTMFAAGAIPAPAQTGGVTIRVGTGTDDQATPLLYAAKSGLYQKYGLDVEIVKLAGSAAIAAAMVGGSLEIGKTNAITLVTAFSKGLPFTVIGSIAAYNAAHPDVAFLVAANANVRTPQDLEGRVLSAVTLQDESAVSTFAWLDRHGVDRSKVKYVEVPLSATLAAMDQGRIVGSTVIEPFYSAFMATGRVRVLGYPFDAIATHFSDTLLFATDAWAAAHRDAVAKFLRATAEASSFITAHEDVSTQLIAEFGGLDPSAIGNIRHAERGVAIGPEDIQPVIDSAAKYGVIANSFPASKMLCTCAMSRSAHP